MKLSELSQADYVKALIFGDSGSGKTCLAASFPTPIEVWDFDNKISSAAKFFAGDKTRLDAIEVQAFASMPADKIIPSFQKRLHEVTQLQNDGKPLPFKTLVLDSFTTFATYLLAAYPKLQPGIERGKTPADLPVLQYYQLLDIHLGDTVKALLKLNCNIVVTGHLTVEKDETSGAIIRQPLIPGKFANKLNIYFEEVYLAKVDSQGRYLLQTQPDSQYKLRTQRKLNKDILSSYDAIIHNTKA